MSRELTPLDRAGEDTLDLAESLGWLVAACTWLRRAAVAAPLALRGAAAAKCRDC